MTGGGTEFSWKTRQFLVPTDTHMIPTFPRQSLTNISIPHALT